MTNDPAIRYAAGTVVVAAFVACLAIAVHGYWQDPSYQLPPLINAILSAGLAGALTLLGVHVGVGGMSQGVGQGAQAAQQGAQVVSEAKTANGAPVPGGR